MAEKNNAKCSICGKDYYMCLSCKDTMSAHPWKMFCDTSNHYQVFQVIRGYNTNVYTKDEARIKLKNINLEDIEDFKPNIKEIIEYIIKEEKTVVEVVEKVEEPVETEIATEELVIEKPIYSRKRSYKEEVE
jgi:uncharacterized CHY-type Zn-finger protein